MRHNDEFEVFFDILVCGEIVIAMAVVGIIVDMFVSCYCYWCMYILRFLGHGR